MEMDLTCDSKIREQLQIMDKLNLNEKIRKQRMIRQIEREQSLRVHRITVNYAKNFNQFEMQNLKARREIQSTQME
jgi:hypothetical protein